MENITIIVVKPEAPTCVKKPCKPSQFSLKIESLLPQSQFIPRMMPSDTVVIPLPSNQMNKATLGKKEDQATTLGVKFVSAGIAACMADAMTFPLDTAKVRLQIQGEVTGFQSGAQSSSSLARSAAPHRVAAAATLQYHGIVGTLCTIARKEGLRAWYQGISAGLQRQMCFASVRIGLYDVVKGKYAKLFGANPDSPNIGVRILAGLTTGSMAVLCAQPTDVVKTRLQAQTAGKKRYNGAIHAYRTIATQEGVAGLWRGLAPNVARNSIVNVTELVSYDLIKEFILNRQLLADSIPCHFLSAVGAGVCTTVLASPVDVVKTRFMNSSPGTYRGALHCASQMYGNEGLKAFYKGCMPSFMRLTCWSILMFVSFEQVKRALTNLKTKDHSALLDKVRPVVENIPTLEDILDSNGPSRFV